MFQSEIDRLKHEHEVEILAAARSAIAAARCEQELHMKQDVGHKPYSTGCFFISSDSEKAIISGEGDLFVNFVKFRHLFGYCGEHGTWANPEDDNYKSSPLRLLEFDQCFKHLGHDVRRC